MRVAIGLGHGPGAKKAAAEAAASARKTVSHPDLAVAFGSIYLDQKEVHEALRAELGSSVLIGDAVNLTQRLESAATPGRLLMSEAVFRQVRGLPGTPERREVSVKGKKASVVAYECGPAP
ncbi:MAG: hypothetical protein HY748_08370 [Elusimicrobia bacterium]|nr:hypothetical protein [Elusimicrobiota bacterium]